MLFDMSKLLLLYRIGLFLFKQQNQQKLMNQILKQKNLKKINLKQQKLQSLRLVDFNEQWNQSIKNNSAKNQNRPNLLAKSTNQTSRNTKAAISNTSKIVVSKDVDKYLNQDAEIASIYPKKKAYSQFQTNKKLNLLGLQSQFTNQKHHFDKEIQNISKNMIQEEIMVNSIQLKPLKLPQIKMFSRQNKIIKKYKVQNLRQVDIFQKIKTLTENLQKQQNFSLGCQRTSQLVKNKYNPKLDKNARNTTLISQNSSKSFISQQKILINENKLLLDSQKKFQENAMNSLRLLNNSIQDSKSVWQSQQKEKTHEESQQDSSRIPKLQIYDKKMKIGKKKKSQEDRIRAMLLKTLEKTKGTDYVAQQGSSQKKSPRNSIPQTKRSLSKGSNDQDNQRLKLSLIPQEKKENKGSLKRSEIQKLKKSLNPSNRLSDSRLPSTYVKNKKLVDMVRAVQNGKRKIEQLEEIKQQTSTNKYENQEQSQKDNQNNIVEEQIYDEEKNEFLP